MSSDPPINHRSLNKYTLWQSVPRDTVSQNSYQDTLITKKLLLWKWSTQNKTGDSDKEPQFTLSLLDSTSFIRLTT